MASHMEMRGLTVDFYLYQKWFESTVKIS